MMISPHFVDFCGAATAFLVPAYIVLFFPRWLFTIPLGAFIFWFTLLVTGILLNDLDPERDGAFGDAIWFVIGFPGGLMYASLLYALRRLYLYFRSHSMSPPT